MSTIAFSELFTAKVINTIAQYIDYRYAWVLVILENPFDKTVAKYIEYVREQENGTNNIQSTSKNVYKFCATVLKNRWKNVFIEKVVAKGYAKYAYRYAKDFIHGKWGSAESAISTSAEYSVKYAKDVSYTRWKIGSTAEDNISYNEEYALAYAITVLQGRWEIHIKNNEAARRAEKSIMKSPESIFKYSLYAIKGRWKEAEHLMMTSPKYLHHYAELVLKKRWDGPYAEEAEKVIFSSPKFAYYYTVYVIKSRCIKAEDSIKQDNIYWAEYKKWCKH